MRKLTPAQEAALTYAGFAKGYPVAPANHATVTWNSLEARGLVSVNRGPNKRDVLGIGLTDAGREFLAAQGIEEAGDSWPAGIEADGSVIALVDISDRQAEALEDVATVGWTPAARNTVESLIRHGLITWVPDTTDPAEFRLTAEGKRAYDALTVQHVVPNRAARRRYARSLKAVGQGAETARKPRSVKALSIKAGMVFRTPSGHVVTALDRARLDSGGVEVPVFPVNPATGEEELYFTPSKRARVTVL